MFKSNENLKLHACLKLSGNKTAKKAKYWDYPFKDQKQPPIGVLRKRCSENMQQIYRRTPMPKCDFNKVALHFAMSVLL